MRCFKKERGKEKERRKEKDKKMKNEGKMDGCFSKLDIRK